MRLGIAVVVLLLVPAWSEACPWTVRSCRPRPIIVYQPCPPPSPIFSIRQPVRFVPAPTQKVQKTPAANEDVAPNGWCHIKGRIVFEGDPIPKQRLIPKSNGAYTEDWVVDPVNRGVKNVIVCLAPEPTAAEWEGLKATGAKRVREFPSFTEKDIYPLLPKPTDSTIVVPEVPIAFIPHVTVVRAGSDVEFRNLSTRPENVKWISNNNGEFSPLVPPNGIEFRIKNAIRERLPIEISSGIHPWMKAWVRVIDHPYYAVTDSSGEFEIRFAPIGKQRLFVWQESAGLRNGKEGRFGEAIQVPSGRLDLGDLKIKELP